ncbi:MAG TPA: hypothetical protein VFB60_26490 [Ktedonobacteraceae bacterium]|nr:hypothetical protein [Ktedonobacteraceae bacterium]
MANEEHLSTLKQGVEAWNQWRRMNPLTCPDLSHAGWGSGLSDYSTIQYEWCSSALF